MLGGKKNKASTNETALLDDAADIVVEISDNEAEKEPKQSTSKPSTAKKQTPSASSSNRRKSNPPLPSSATQSIKNFFTATPKQQQPKSVASESATPLPKGWTRSFTTRPTGAKDFSYFSPDGTKFRSYVAVVRYCTENGIEIEKGEEKEGDGRNSIEKTPAAVHEKTVKTATKSVEDAKMDKVAPLKTTTTTSTPVAKTAPDEESSSEEEEEIPLVRKRRDSRPSIQEKKPSPVNDKKNAGDSVKADEDDVEAPKSKQTKKRRIINDDDESDFECSNDIQESSSSESENSSDAMEEEESETEIPTEKNHKKRKNVISDSDDEEDIFEAVKPSNARLSMASVKSVGSTSSTGKPKNVQSSIASFFGGGGSAKGTPVAVAEVKKGKPAPKKKPVAKKVKLDEDGEGENDNEGLAELEPINKLDEMFSDMITRVPKLYDTVKTLSAGRPPLRLATMCSGTESPLLAIKLIGEALSAKLGIPDVLKIHHVFSCEIEPFKQAYIDRNFSPPILFRDVRQLCNDTATTAYGATVAVPGNVDILIAGTSCVDYSSLNNKKQGIEAAGESGDTFRGMLGWVANHRPPIVILENVCGAPWDKVVDLFDGVGYDASFMRADTKKYYIPHTRTRVYLVALSRDEGLGYGDDLAEEWKEVFKGISRNASTPLEDYLLPTDDPRIHRARQDLAKTKDNVATNRRTEWSRCESRHAFARINEELGNKRPLTAWSEGGMSNFPDFAWNDWGRTQTDRVLDLSDINYLRSAKTGVDVIYKTMVWNLSQNVDRNTASSNPGICPCLTPTMIACITNRGGPLVGLEALSLQGIPVNELLLTRETEDQLADLAGNAMTSTVVGAAFLAALVVGAEGLLTFGQQLAANMDTSEIAGPCVVEDILDNHVIGTQVLHPGHLKLGVQETTLARDIIMKADSTSRHCVCEGREGISRSPIQTCIECNHSSCLNCGGRPEHVYDASNTISPQSRSNPSRFADTFKSSLPMRLFINWITLDALNEIADSMKPSPKSVDLELFKAWADIVSGVLAPTETQKVCEFRFSTLKRQEVWTAVYVSDRARLVLDLDPKAPQWELYVCAPKGTVGAVREALKSPVAHMKIDLAADPMITLSDALVKGKWAVFIPALFKFKVSVTGEGQLVDSWEARLGLEGRFKGNQVWSNWRVKNVSDDTITLPFGGIDGTYRAIAKCGTAMDYLHVKKAEENGNPLDLFFFLDPTRCGNPSEDPFVFATRSRRLEYGEQRSPIALLDPSWRPTAEAGEQMVDASVHGIWADLNESVSMSMTELEAKQADIAVLQKQDFISFMESISTTQAKCCESSVALVEVKVELGTYVEDVWSKNDWNEVDLVKSGKAVFEKVAWFSERINMPTWVTDWTFMDAKELGLGCLTHGTSPCTKCAPNEPKILWIPNTKGNAKSFMAIEDPSQAGVYENALKNRPNVFVCQLKLEENDAKKNVGIFRVGLNFASLIHRAAARLITVPFSVDSSATGFEFSWKLTCDPTFSSVSRSMLLPKLELKSNRHDRQVPQPPNFKKYPLRPEQVRSLGWMIRQEEEPVEFTEEEISEASLEYLGWRAEGRASRSVLIRGGVVADEVGYGKTAITLGLIDHGKNEKSYNEPRPEIHGRIPVKATLILVPGHLLKQWPSEIKKFTGETLTTIVITDVGNLNKLTIREVIKADIVITSSKIFNSAKYWDNVEVFAANGRLPPDPKKGGRYFNSRYQDCLESMKNQVEKLKKGELSDMISNIEAAMDQAVLDDEKAKTLNLVQTKRLKGKQYRDKSKKASGKSEEMEVDEVEEEEEEDEEDIKSTKKHKLGKSSLADPWGLTSGDVKKSWKNLKCPPFELFHWNRLVVDEFTYLTDRIHAAVINVSSVNRWILSGTPPVKDFNDIKSIAVFLGVHLGVDDESDFSGVKAKRRKREATSVEQFHAFREIHTHEWHARRHGIAQGFLNQFVRQNIAEIDEIFAEEVLIRVELPPAERAIYLELEHHLQALDMNSKKAIKFKTGMDGDRDRRMVTALGASSTAEEALMKRCSHFALDEGTDGGGGGKAGCATAGDESEEEDEEVPDDKPVKVSSSTSSNANRKLMTAAETCREIVSTRNRQLIECVSDLWTQINRIKLTRQTAKSRSDYKDHCRSTRSKDATDSVDHFDKWLMMVGSGGHVGDVEAMAIIVVLIHKARCVDEGSLADDLISKAYKELLGPEKTVDIVENVLKISGLVDIDLKAVLKAGGAKGSAGKQSDSKGSKAAKKKSEDDAEADENGDFEATLAKISGKGKFDLLEVLHFIREETHAGGRLQKELVGRVRSLRFFNGVDSIVLSDRRFDILSSAIRNCSQESCTSDKNATPEKMEYVVQNSAILSCCGHMGCLSCVERSAANQKCLQKGCSIVVHDKAIVPTTVFGDLLSTDATGSSTASGRFGAKLMQLVKIIQERVLPNKEKVLIFVQFDDLMEKVGHALDQFGIEHLEIKGSSSAKSSALALFQNAEGGGGKGNAKSPPVLLLNVGDESAAGANLTVANHVVFLNPLFHQSNEWIQACETQAIGRCRRYGQQKKVWIYRMLASETIDTVLFEKRANFINSQ